MRGGRAVPEQPPGRGEGVASDLRVGAPEHERQQGGGSRAQAVPHGDQPILLQEQGRVRERPHVTHRRKKKVTSYGSNAEGLTQNAVVDESAVDVSGGLCDALGTRGAGSGWLRAQCTCCRFLDWTQTGDPSRGSAAPRTALGTGRGSGSDPSAVSPAAVGKLASSMHHIM